MNNDESIITISRPWNLIGCWSSFVVLIDQKYSHGVSNGARNTFKVSPGTHSIFVIQELAGLSASNIIEVQSSPDRPYSLEAGYTRRALFFYGIILATSAYIFLFFLDLSPLNRIIASGFLTYILLDVWLFSNLRFISSLFLALIGLFFVKPPPG